MDKTSFFYRKKHFFIYLAMAGFYIWLASRIPYTHDDWDWGLDNGLHQWLHATVNSRYLGNFFEVVMTRSEAAKTLIMGAGFFLIPCMITELAVKQTGNGKIKWLCYALSNILILAMDRGIWRQTYGWVAGYANFVISSVFMLVLVKKGLEIDQNQKCRLWESIALCVLSFMGQLFLENLAIFMVAFFLLRIIACYRKYHSVPKQLIFMLAGAVLGLVVMFSSGIYITLLTTGKAIGNYRQLNINGAESPMQMLRGFFVQAVNIPYRLWGNQLILSLLVLGVMSLCAWKNAPRKKALAMIGVNVLFAGCLIGQNCIASLQPESLVDMVIHGGLSGLYFLAICGEIFLVFPKSARAELLRMWLLAPCVILPLVATSELGARLFFTSNIFMIVFAEMAISEIWSGCEKLHKWSYRVSAVLLLTLLCCHGFIYGKIGACKVQRDALIRQAIANQQEIVSLPTYPYDEYLWHPDPDNAQRLQYFKEFYELDPDTKVIFKKP